MEKYERVEQKKTKKEIFFDNFMGGIAWGIGSALGALILITILGFILSKLNLVPYLGSFVAQIAKYTNQKEIENNIPFTSPAPKK